MKLVRPTVVASAFALALVGALVAPSSAAPAPAEGESFEPPQADVWEPDIDDGAEIVGGAPPEEPWTPFAEAQTGARSAQVLSAAGAPGDTGYYTFHDFWMDGDEGRQQIRVNVASGNLFVRSTLSELAGPGVPARVDRIYNSQQAPYFGSLLGSWQADYSITGIYRERSPEYATFYDGTGASWEFWNDGDSWTSPPGVNASLTYDINMGGDWTLTYNRTGEKLIFNDDGFLRQRVDRNGVGLTYNYTAGKVTSITDGAGKNIQIAGNSTGYTSSVGTAGRYTTLTYDANNRLSKVSEAARPEWSYTYNTAGLLASVAGGGRTIAFVYDSSKRVTQVTQSRPSEPNVVTSFSYAATTSTVTDPRGGTVTYELEGERVKKATDQLGRTRSQTWSANFDVVTSTDGFSTGGNSGNVTTSTYDALSNQTSITLPTGAAVQARYSTGPDCPGAQSGNPYRVKCTTDAQGNKSAMEYDTAGNPTKQTDTTPGGVASVTSYTYENQAGTICGGKQGQTCTATDARGKVTKYNYTNGMLTKVTPPAPLGVTTYAYDGVGRVTSVTDGNGDTTSYAYDGADRITLTTYDNGQTLTSTYNADGTLASQVDSATQVTITSTYNVLGKKLTERTFYPLTSGVAPAIATTVVMAYDASGNLTSTNETGAAVRYAYDAANQLVQTWPASSSCTTAGNPAPNSGCVKFAYDNNGAETARVFPGGARQDTVRDSVGRATRITAKDAGGTVRSDIGYSFNQAGTDRLEIQTRTSHREQGIALNAVTTYTYDSQNRLTSAVERNGATTTATWAYAYDKAGNRTSQTRSGSTGQTAGTTTFTFNDANQIASSSADTTTWTYDGAGNQTRNGITGAVITYGDRLQATSSAGETHGTFGDGNTMRLSSGGATFLTTDLGLARRNVATASQSTTYHRTTTGDLVSYSTAGASRYLTADHQGTIVGVFSATGVWQGGYSYSPYGERRFSASENSVPRNFTGFIGGFEDSPGIYKLGARYYDTSIGRFTQMDPAGQEENPYLYAQANPCNVSDPTGMMSCGQALFWVGVSIVALMSSWSSLFAIAAKTTARQAILAVFGFDLSVASLASSIVTGLRKCG